MKHCLFIHSAVVRSYQRTLSTAPAWEVFPVVLGEAGWSFFPAKERSCQEWNSRVSVLHSAYTISVVAVNCLSFSAVARVYCSISVARRGQRAGAACEANLLKALAPNFTSADAGKHSVTFLWSTRLPSQARLGSGTPSSMSLST